MTAKRALLLIVGLFFLIWPKLALPSTPADDYVVYADFIREHSWERAELRKLTLKTYVVRSKTDAREINQSNLRLPRLTDYMMKSLPGLDPSTARSFEARNAKRTRLQASRFGGLPVVLMPRRTEHQIFRPDSDWDEFYKRYPDSQGLLTLSRVGFSDDHRQALLYYGNQWAGLAGDGALVLLIHDGQRWVISQRCSLWVS